MDYFLESDESYRPFCTGSGKWGYVNESHVKDPKKFLLILLVIHSKVFIEHWLDAWDRYWADSGKEKWHRSSLLDSQQEIRKQTNKDSISYYDKCNEGNCQSRCSDKGQHEETIL